MLGLNKDGTAVLDLGAGPTRLRRPTLGEFRRLREAAWAITEDAATAIESLSVTVDPTDTDPDPRVTTAPERRKLLHEATAAMDDAWTRWTADAVSTLGDRAAPDEDGWPAWAAGQGVPTQLMGHWRDVPLVSGGPPR